MDKPIQICALEDLFESLRYRRMVSSLAGGAFMELEPGEHFVSFQFGQRDGVGVSSFAPGGLSAVGKVRPGSVLEQISQANVGNGMSGRNLSFQFRSAFLPGAYALGEKRNQAQEYLRDKALLVSKLGDYPGENKICLIMISQLRELDISQGEGVVLGQAQSHAGLRDR